MSNLRQVIITRIADIAGAEKITKVQLGLVSRELLLYVPDSADIDVANRLLSVLTPMNRTTAILFFQHFLPWESENTKDGDFIRFGKKMQGEKKVSKRLDLIKEFLADEANNIWTWAVDNVDIAPKQKDFAGMIERTIAKAIEGDDKSNTPALERDAILAAVFAGGVTMEDMFEAIDIREALVKAEMDAAEADQQEIAGAEFEAEQALKGKEAELAAAA